MRDEITSGEARSTVEGLDRWARAGSDLRRREKMELFEGTGGTGIAPGAFDAETSDWWLVAIAGESGRLPGG